MYRFLTVLVLAGLLVACTDQGDGQSDASLDSAPTSTAAASAAGSGAASSRASAACVESFAALGEMDVASLSDLGDLEAEVQPTVEACESVADWVAAAQDVIGEEVNPNTAAFLLQIHCADLSLGDTSICEELAAS